MVYDNPTLIFLFLVLTVLWFTVSFLAWALAHPLLDPADRTARARLVLATCVWPIVLLLGGLYITVMVFRDAIRAK